MTQPLKIALLESEAMERRDALRALLGSPLITDDDERFAKIARHRAALVKAFAEYVGWRLDVDVNAGYARLLKVAHRPHDDRPLLTASKTRPQPFEKRRYELLCLVLAALDEQSGQTTLANIARRVREIAVDDGLVPFEPERFHERRALTDVLLWLEQRRVLQARDGDTERYAHEGAAGGDALYDVHDRLVGLMISAPQSPSAAGDAAAMARDMYPESTEGDRLRARHEVLRALFEDPVVYTIDLSPDARTYLENARAWIYETLERQLGFDVERRREGLAAIDATTETTDIVFPDGSSTVKHAALLLAEQITERHRESIVAHAEIERVALLLAQDFPSWSAEYQGVDGARQLAGDAMDLLASFRLVERTEDGWRARPAIARMRPELKTEGTPS